MLTVARRSIPSGSVEITRRVVARFGLSVTQPGSDIAILRSNAGLSSAHSCQLIDPGVFAVPGGLCPIFGCDLAVIDGLCAVVRSLGAPRGSRRTVAVSMATIARRAIPRGAVEIARRVVACFGLPVALLGLSVADVRSQVAVAPFYVALTRGREGVLAIIRATAVLIWACNGAIGISHVCRFQAPASRCGAASFGRPP